MHVHTNRTYLLQGFIVKAVMKAAYLPREKASVAGISVRSIVLVINKLGAPLTPCGRVDIKIDRVSVTQYIFVSYIIVSGRRGEEKVVHVVEYEVAIGESDARGQVC
jgi:hypothetical protein